MIEKCILEVYQRDKKVFLPEFGAIIYSDFNDSVDFNDLLTFDDGKVTEEIQNQLSLTEDEARKALEEHVQQIKDTLGKGKLHYFSGIGYLSKDDQGNYAIQKSDPLAESTPKKKTTSKKSSQTTESGTKKTTRRSMAKKKEEEPISDEIAANPPLDETPQSESPIAEEEVKIPEPEEITTDSIENFSAEETEYEVEEDKTFNSFSSEDNFYKEYDEQHEEKKNSSKGIIWMAIVVILLSIGGFYLYKVFFAHPVSDNKELVAGIDENTPKENQTPVINSTPKDDAQSIEDSEAMAESNSTLSEASNSTESSSSTIDPSDPDEQKTYSLILGSFKEESNADKYLQRLNSRGLVVDKFKGMKNFYFVGIEKIEGKSNAVRQLEEIKKKEPSAWIYNVDRLL